MRRRRAWSAMDVFLAKERRNPSRRLVRAVDEWDIGRMRALGGRWLARLLWRDALAAAAAGSADGAHRRKK